MLRSFGYACHRSAELGAPPTRLRVLGHDFVLWRDGGGRVVAPDDRCPHRGGSVSPGTCSGGHIVCPCHGRALDAGGACVPIPADAGGARIPREAQVRSNPNEERHGRECLVERAWGLRWDEPEAAAPAPWVALRA